MSTTAPHSLPWNADFNDFSDVCLRGHVHVDWYRFLVNSNQKSFVVTAAANTYKRAKLWKKIKRSNLKNESTGSKKKRKISARLSGERKVERIALEEFIWCFHFGVLYFKSWPGTKKIQKSASLLRFNSKIPLNLKLEWGKRGRSAFGIFFRFEKCIWKASFSWRIDVARQAIQ